MAIRRVVDVCDDEWLEAVREDARERLWLHFAVLRLCVIGVGFLSLLSLCSVLLGYAVGWLA